MNLFQRQSKLGEIGEALVGAYLQRNGRKVIDVTKDKNYFAKDIDFLCSDEDGVNFTSLDVKYDTCFTYTGNLFIEYELAYETGCKPGWIKYCLAEYIYYVDAATHMCLIFKTEEMKEYVEENNCKTVVCRDGFKDARGYAVPAAEYKLTGNYYKVIDLKESF